jgi:type IV secretion system protein VirB9
MSVQWGVLVALCASLSMSSPMRAQSEGKPEGKPAPTRGARTIVYHPRDLIALHAKLHYTTLIVLPEGEDVVEATSGDKEFWIVNARGALVSVKPAKPGSETNLNLVTTSGQVYAFVLSEVSDQKGQEPDLAVYLEPEDGAAATAAREHPKYVSAQQVEDFRAQAAVAREDARRATEAARLALESGLTAFRTTYPLGLAFPYQFKADKAPFFLHAMFHDGHRTYLQARASELPSLYELKDGAPSLVNFEVHDGTYVVPKVLDSGYLMLGQQRIPFTRVDAR